MTYIYAPHATDPAKLAAVIAEMRTLGAPTIRAVWTGDYWLAIEGSHRLAAAHALGLTPEIDEIATTDEIDHDLDLDSRLVADIAEYLAPDSRTPTYNFDGI
jgi:hypothetical protein